MMFSESNTKIAPALTKAWAELENPKHNTSVTVKIKSGGSYKFDYTDLGGIFDEAKKVFKDNQLTIIQNAHTIMSEGKKLISVETMILHSSGEYVKSEPLSMEASNSIQDMGGQVTYMKRYSLSAMLGIATEKDDDANGASGNSYEQSNKKASDKQLDFAKKLIKGKVSDEYNETQIIATLAERLKVSKNMTDWSPGDASKVIKRLQEGKQGS